MAGQAEPGRRLLGLGDADGGQGVAVLVRVLRALLPLGADQLPHGGPTPGPPGQRPAGRDLGVVGMAVDRQRAPGDLGDEGGAGGHCRSG